MGTALRTMAKRSRAFALFCVVAVVVSGAGFAQAADGTSAAGASATAAAPSGEAIARRSFVVDFDGFAATGELTYPAAASGPFPTVILVHGSGPADMNNSILDYDVMTGDMVVQSAIFADIAASLSEAGYAVIRYNKRFVVGPNELDYLAYVMNVDMHTLVADLRTVVEFAQNEPLVDNERLFLYGWSEGSTVAADVAATYPELAGLIVQTPVALGWRETFEYQIHDVGLDYLRRVAGVGPVTNATLMTILSDAEAGVVAKSVANYIADGAAFQAGQIAVNSMLDVNGDGELHIDGEIVAGLDMLLDFAFGPMGPLAMYGPGQALPVLSERVDELQLPVLILQGAEDANVPVDGARRLARLLEQAGVEVTLHVYEGLGHSLGPAENRLQDVFAPITEEPLHDLKRWLEAR